MDNQKIVRFGKADARQLTKEIDQATDLMVGEFEGLQMAAGAEQLRTAQARIGQLGTARPLEDGMMNGPVLSDLGRGGLGVIEGGKGSGTGLTELGRGGLKVVEGDGGFGPMPANERVALSTQDVGKHNSLAGATQELQRDTAEIERPEEFVGLETRVQRKEYERDDAHDAQLEDGVGNPWEVQIVRNSQEQLGKQMAEAVEGISRQKSFQVKGLYDLFRKQRTKALENQEGARRIGDRN